jgi:acetolactate synthase-1/2/3 large subunit
MNGAKLVIEALEKAGVTKIFGLSGNQIMSLYDACIGTSIELVHVRQEAAASYMAEAWAQLTGEIGVALIAGGPAFCNGLGALYQVRASETPVILLTGDGPVSADGTGAFQELDQVAIAKPLVKASFRSTSAGSSEHDTRNSSISVPSLES